MGNHEVDALTCRMAFYDVEVGEVIVANEPGVVPAGRAQRVSQLFSRGRGTPVRPPAASSGGGSFRHGPIGHRKR